jgi:hypothetical protein
MINEIDTAAPVSAGELSRVQDAGCDTTRNAGSAAITPDNRDLIDKASATLPSSIGCCATSFEDIASYLEPGIAYVSQPVFNGIDCSIWISASAVQPVQQQSDEVDPHWLAAMCDVYSDELQRAHRRLAEEYGGDSIRLDGRIVLSEPGSPDLIDIHRIVIFSGDAPLFERPYTEHIFENDAACSRLLTFVISPEDAMRATRDWTSAMIRANSLEENGDSLFEGFLWLPLKTGRYRPSVFVSYHSQRFSEIEACEWSRRLFRREIENCFHIDGWRSR